MHRAVQSRIGKDFPIARLLLRRGGGQIPRQVGQIQQLIFPDPEAVVRQQIHMQRRVQPADERRRYLTIGASDTLSGYSNDREFQRWCELGLKLRRQNRLGAYVKKLEELLEQNESG